MRLPVGVVVLQWEGISLMIDMSWFESLLSQTISFPLQAQENALQLLLKLQKFFCEDRA
jgi:hypothetical protein